MTITAEREEIIEGTAISMGVSTSSVGSLFAFIDGFRLVVGDAWRDEFPSALIRKAQDGTPWAEELLKAALDDAFGTVLSL